MTNSNCIGTGTMEVYTRSKFETVAVPFQTLGNKSILTGTQLFNEPYLLAFVKHFPDCFEHSLTGDYVVFYPDGQPSQTTEATQ